MLLIAASRGDKPASILRSTFSTTTMASSTTMPIAKHQAEQRQVVEREAEHRHEEEGADQRHRNGDDAE